MDFVKKILHQISRKSEAVSQITFDEDYNVPDARPDVGRMIQKKGEVTIGDVQISEGKARVFGGLTFHLLYVSDGERAPDLPALRRASDRRDDPSRWSDRGATRSASPGKWKI